MLGLYIEVDGVPQPVEDMEVWAEQFSKKENRLVAFSKTLNGQVSTVFLGIDHSFGGGTPLLYETMIFGGSLDGYQERYGTRAEAHAGHRRAVKADAAASNYSR